MQRAVAVAMGWGALAVCFSPVFAQEPAPALDLADGSSADRTVTITLQRASLDAELRIENRSNNRLHVRIVTTPLRGTDGQAVTTTWQRHADGTWVGVSGEPFELRPYEPLDLAMRAELARAGTYTSQVSLFSREQPNGAEQHQRTIALTVNREMPTLDDLIMTPAPLLTDKLIPFLGRDIALRLPLQNTTAAPQELRMPVLTEVVRDFTADLSYAVELRDVAVESSCPASDGEISLSPDGVCAVTFTIPGIRQAGSYSAKVAVAGSDGGRKESLLLFDIRLHWAWAAVVVLAGIFAGGLITTWRTRGREQYLRLEETAELVTELEALRARAASLGLEAAVDATLAGARRVRAKIIAGRADDVVADLSQSRERAVALANWLGIETTCRELEAIDVALLLPKLEAVRGAFGVQAFAKDEVERQLGELREELVLARRRTGLRRKYLSMARSRALLPYLREAGDPAVARAAEEADEALKQVGTLLAGSGTQTLQAIAEAEIAFRAGVEGLVGAAATYVRTLTGSGRPPWFEEAAWNALIDDLDARAGQIEAGGDAGEVQARIESALLAYVRADAAALRSGAAARLAAETDATKKASWKALGVALDGLEVLQEPARLPQALRFLRAQASRYVELAGIAESHRESAASVAVTTPELSVLEPDWPVPWFVRGTDPPATISRRRILLDWVINACVAVLLVLAALQILWVPNATWGSFGDVITAFLAGAAVYSGLGTMLQQWTGQVRQGWGK
jgi:hypothetical protein